MLPKMIVIEGTNASGKSALGVTLAARFSGEIVSADSRQVYERLDLGSGKIMPEEMAGVPHHLLNVVRPGEFFSMADFQRLAYEAIDGVLSRGNLPFLVGGTGLYLQGLVTPMGMGSIPAREELREELRTIAEGPDGRQLLDERLRKSDPETADRLPLNDLRRRIRAIEVSETTGIPFSHQPQRQGQNSFIWRIAATAPERSCLYERINLRVSRMMEAGLEQEVRRLLDSGVPEDAQSMSAIGYKEMIPLIYGEVTAEEVAEEIRLRSRHYAKRQMTFLRRIEGIRYVDPESGGAYQEIRSILAP